MPRDSRGRAQLGQGDRARAGAGLGERAGRVPLPHPTALTRGREHALHGAQLVAITPQKPDKSTEQLKKDGYPFLVLSDLGSSVMKAYRLFYELDPELVKVYKKFGLNVEDFNGPGRNVLPVPGTFVLDQKGVVRARHADTDYTKRMEPTEIIKILKAL